MKKYIGITGAAGGIGETFCEEYIKKGFFVVGIDSDEEKLQKLKIKFKDNFEYIVCNVTRKKSLFEALDFIFENYGVPDFWFNNAGVANLKPFKETSSKDFSLVMSVNFDAVVQCTRFWLEKMCSSKRGVIVNISSMAGIIAPPYMASYVASKHAVYGLTKALQAELELDESPVKCVVVCPGFVNTPIMKIGEKRGFPKKLDFLVSTPRNCVKEIITALEKGETEIYPTFNAKIIGFLERVSPKFNKASGRLLVSKNFKQLLGLEKIKY